MPTFVVRALRPEDREWVAALAAERWGGPAMVTRGRVHRMTDLPGFCAEVDGARAGLITYSVDQDGLCEIVSLDSLREGLGIGTALIEAVRREAEARGCPAMVLVTTNDNTRALRFYQRRGWIIAAARPGAIAAARALKPAIPLIGADGIPIRDEIELRLELTPART